MSKTTVYPGTSSSVTSVAQDGTTATLYLREQQITYISAFTPTGDFFTGGQSRIQLFVESGTEVVISSATATAVSANYGSMIALTETATSSAIFVNSAYIAEVFASGTGSVIRLARPGYNQEITVDEAPSAISGLIASVVPTANNLIFTDSGGRMANGQKIEFRDAGSWINSPSAGTTQVAATTNVSLQAPTTTLSGDFSIFGHKNGQTVAVNSFNNDAGTWSFGNGRNSLAANQAAQVCVVMPRIKTGEELVSITIYGSTADAADTVDASLKSISSTGTVQTIQAMTQQTGATGNFTMTNTLVFPTTVSAGTAIYVEITGTTAAGGGISIFSVQLGINAK